MGPGGEALGGGGSTCLNPAPNAHGRAWTKAGPPLCSGLELADGSEVPEWPGTRRGLGSGSLPSSSVSAYRCQEVVILGAEGLCVDSRPPGHTHPCSCPADQSPAAHELRGGVVPQPGLQPGPALHPEQSQVSRVRGGVGGGAGPWALERSLEPGPSGRGGEVPTEHVPSQHRGRLLAHVHVLPGQPGL